MATSLFPLLTALTLLEFQLKLYIENPQDYSDRLSCQSFSVLPQGESGQLYIHCYFPHYLLPRQNSMINY